MVASQRMIQTLVTRREPTTKMLSSSKSLFFNIMSSEHQAHENTRIGIAIGPRTWFGDRYGANVSTSGTVINNRLSGAFGYGIAMSSARNFTVEQNVLFGNTSFIGSRGPNCSNTDTTPTPAPFVIDLNTTTQSTTQLDFQQITDGDGLTCILPPDGGDYWPFGGSPETSGNQANGSNSGGGGLSGGAKAGIAIAVILGVAAIAAGCWYVRRWALQRAAASQHQTWERDGYIRSKEDVGV